MQVVMSIVLLQLDVLQARGLGEAESPETKSVLEQLTKLAAQSSARLATGGRTSQSSLLVCGGRGAMWMPIGWVSALLLVHVATWLQSQVVIHDGCLCFHSRQFLDGALEFLQVLVIPRL